MPIHSVSARFWEIVNVFLPSNFPQLSREQQRRIRVQLAMSLGLAFVYLGTSAILTFQAQYPTIGAIFAVAFAGVYFASILSVRMTHWGQKLISWMMFLVPLITYFMHSWRIGGEPIPERIITFPLMMSLALGIRWGVMAIGAVSSITYGFQFYEATWGDIPVTLVLEVREGVEQLPLVYMVTVVVIVWFLELERQHNQQQIQQELERRQEAELQKQLAEARREDELKMLEQSKLAMLGETSASIAHEINNPLAYLVGVMDLWALRLNRKQTLDPQEFQESLKEAQQQAERITSIVQHLRNFGRSDAGGMQHYRINAPLDGALLLLRHSLSRANISLEVEIAENLPELKGNPGHLEQVLLNLLGNARDALEEHGGGTVRVTAQALESDPTQLELQVTDDGPGIPQEVQQRIFTAFYTTKPAGKGTGLGLSICQGIVQNLGGTLSCHSEVGKGTAFRIQVPLQPPPVED